MRVGRSRYVSPKERECTHFVVFAVALVVLSGLLYYFERERFELNTAYHEASQIIREAHSTKVTEENSGSLIHVNGTSLRSTSEIVDPDFNLAFGFNSVRLRRQVEYCQWREHSIDKTYEDADGHKHTIRTYYYTKGWSSTRIISAFFDQPFAHDNPLRDPFPYYDVTAPSATMGPYTINQQLLGTIDSFKLIGFNPQELLKGFTTSAARTAHGFTYVGNGYFYSSWQPNNQLFKWFGQYLEGSLFDFQIGDLFSQCTAGDIRIQFYAATAENGVSVIGKQLDVQGLLGIYETTRNYHLGIVKEGYYTAEQMFESGRNQIQWTVWIIRFLAFCFLSFTSLFIFPKGHFLIYLFFGLSSTSTLVSLLQVYFWGFDLFRSISFLFSGFIMVSILVNQDKKI